MMLEWAAEQPTEITTTAIDLEFLPTDADEERGVQNLEFVLKQMHTALMALTSCETMTLSPTRGRIRWRHGGDCRSDMIRRQEEESGTFCARSFLLDDALFWNSKQVSNAGSPTCRATRKKLMDKLDDEIKLAGLESLVPEELEKLLILKSNRL